MAVRGKPAKGRDTLEIRARLLKASDDLTARIKAANTLLHDLGLGVEASIDGFGYGKIDHEWTLYAVNPDTQQRIPLTRASRELRLKAIPLIPVIIQEQQELAADLAGRIEKALTA